MNPDAEQIQVEITQKEQIARDIYFLKLSLQGEGSLPACEPGSHIAVETPDGDSRWYSICKTEGDNSYCIAVKREADGRGGSISLVDNTEVGSCLNITAPNNEFELVEAPAYLLIAGGIGITPIYSMWKRLLDDEHANVQLVYLARSPQETLFLDELSQDQYKDKVTIHHTCDSNERYDFWDLLATPSAKHIYCCGSKSLMTDIKDMTGHWPSSKLHFEDFKPVEAVRVDDKPFQLVLAKSGKTIGVSESETLLHALRTHGHKISSSCESGTCGSCKITYLDGDVDHRDLVLEDTEKEGHLMACVSRAKGDTITLDL